MKAVYFSLLLLSTLAHADVISFPVAPTATDPAIKTFVTPHWIYVNRSILIDRQADLPPDRHQLLLWLTGTGGSGHDARAFCELAANLGYHVVSLMYPDEVPASACDNDPDPNGFERFRMAVIQGGAMTKRNGAAWFSVDPPESIENRLIKLLQVLQEKRPRENWGQFIRGDGTIKWDSIAVAGQSQGGGHAALIGIKHEVARVVCFGAPKDYSTRLRAPAAWYGEPSATPKSRFFAFNHHQDPKGCTPEQLILNLRSLESEAFGTPAEVDEEPFPYHYARVLYTSYPVVTVEGQGSEGAMVAHGSGINSQNAQRWQQVWTYLLTETTS